jgi:hypothetical protein
MPISVEGSVMSDGNARVAMLSEPDVKVLGWYDNRLADR